MRVVIHDMAELTDSRELFLAKPHPFRVYFIYLVIALLCIALVWAGFSQIDVVVKANGTVRPLDKISTLTTTMSGTIEHLSVQNGDYVEKGSVILQSNLADFSVESESLERKIAETTEEVRLLELFKNSLSANENLFSTTHTETEENYYYKFNKFLLDRMKINENIQLYGQKLNEASRDIAANKAFLRSIESGSNEFSSTSANSDVYQEYISYTLQAESLKVTLDQALVENQGHKELFEVGSISKTEMDTSNLKVVQTQNTYNKLTSSTKSSLKSSIDTLTLNMETYRSELRKLVPADFGNQNDLENVISTFETETTIANSTQLLEQRKLLSTLKEQRKTLVHNMSKASIVAPISGHIQLVNELSIGDRVTANTKIGAIIPETAEVYKIQIYVPNKDIANVDIGDRVKYRFQALPYKEYGTLEGKITNISVDAQFNQAQGGSYYLVESTVENRPLTSYKGTEGQIKVGMALEAQVISETKNLLLHLLEKIDLWD